MLRILRGGLTYANVASTLALVLALSGSAVAVTTLARNSVYSKHIVNRQVKEVDLADNAITGAKVKNGALTIADVRNVVARPFGNEDISTGDGGFGSPVTYPMNNNTWTQGATESDLFTGKMTYTRPGASCTGAIHLRVSVYVDDELVGSGNDRFPLSPPGTTETVRMSFTNLSGLPEPASADSRTITITAYDDCPNAGDNFIIHSVNISVIGFR